MRQFLLYTLFLAIIFSCGGSASTETATPTAPAAQGTGDLADFDIFDVPGSSLKRAEKRDTENNLTEEGNLVNGKKEGAWVSYYDGRNQGKVKTITNFYNGVKNGIALTFAKNGTVETKSRYLNGKLNGEYSKYKSSRVLESTTYKNGEIDGVYKTFYTNGKIQQEAEFKNGKKDGTSTYYNENEQVTMKYEYKDGKQVSGGKVKVEPLPVEEK